MPIYEFECNECSEMFEERVEHMGDTAPCPKCGAENVKRLLSASAVVVKGGSSGCASGECPMPSGPPMGGGCCPGGMCGHS